MYTIARKFWNVSKWIWLTFIITFLIGLAANLAVVQTTDLHKTVLVSVLNWFVQFGIIQKVLLIVFGLFIVFTLISLISIMLGEHASGGKILRKYLHAVVEEHQGLNPRGFAQQSAMISVNVPLDAIFIHLNAVSDRPLYDLPLEQQKLLEEFRSDFRQDLTPEQREDHIQRLRVLWYSQLGQDWAEGRQKQHATIEDVLKALKAERPVSVILGTPGSGKSTTMRWLALQMARASLPHGYKLPEGLTNRQIPVLIRISDYAKRPDAENMPFRQFLTEYIARTYPELTNLSNTLLDELKRGHCLLLFDGLDEMASDSLRRRVAENIYAFISDYDADSATAQRFNRFIVTSRIVGYEAGTFNKYAHYTLLDLEDEQIEQFLANWYPAVERYQDMASQGMKPLTAQQEAQATKKGNEQRDRLLEALENNPSIKLLAVNPLMLTILALIQRSGRTLPHRRIELYQVVTRTLLDNWNKEKGNRVFAVEEIPLAEQLLGDFAYRLHSSDPVLSEQNVMQIASQAMDTFYQRQSGETKDAAVQDFIETLRSSSGLFVESGQGLFSFMHRTFQEYYAALYLLRKPPGELKQFVIDKHNIAVWHEPLLLAIAYKSIQSSLDEHRQASDLIAAIANTTDAYETFLHRSLLFAANCMVDCSAWSIDAKRQQGIALRLLELYGDSFGDGRYTRLQQDIEQVALLWLRGQPQGSSQQNTWPPLLEAWRIALCDDKDALRQEGAAHLLASIAPDLASCPKTVLNALVPLLLQLAGVQDWYRHDLSCPQEIRAQLFQTTARSCSLRIEEYAFVTLRLLDAAGPAGWLHEDWCKWGEERPELLQRLSRHSLEIDYLLAPAAFPASEDDPDLEKQLNITNEWKKIGQRNTLALQAQLLQTSDTARYPHAYLLKQLLENEMASPATPWRAVWDTSLENEMSFGNSATYQICLNLLLLLCKDNTEQKKKIENGLMTTLSKPGQQQTKALFVISNLYLRDLRYMLNRREIQFKRDILDMQDMQELPSMLDLRYLRDISYLNLQDMQYLLNLRYLRNQLDLRYLRYLLGIFDMLNIQNMLNIRDLLDKDQIIDILCNILKHQVGTISSTALFALYCVLSSYDTIPPNITEQIHDSIEVFERLAESLSLEQHQLVEVIIRRIRESSTPFSGQPEPVVTRGMPDERVTQLDALKQQDRLRKGDVEEILAACMDTRKMSEEKWEELIQAGEFYRKANWTGTVGQFAWKLLSYQPFSIEAKALPTVVQALNDSDAVVCAAAALLLRNCKKIPQDMRVDAAKRLMGILAHDELSRRPLDPPEYSKIWRLDDVLFETLKVLAES